MFANRCLADTVLHGLRCRLIDANLVIDVVVATPYRGLVGKGLLL